MEKRWKIAGVNEQQTDSLRDALKINKALCSILVQRGILTFDSARSFFRPDLDELHSPWLMKGMQEAVERILSAFERKEKILVYGDYDVDGTTAVSVMFSFLKNNYDPTRLDFYIPNRYREGYGVSKAGVDFAIEKDFSLVIALDCGVKSNELVAYAKENGVDFIICDHHLPGTSLPEAVAILDPKQPGCDYPYKELCGCGVGFKLISAIAEKLDLASETYFRYLDLVAAAIAADIVPITGENRILAWHGLKRINSHPCAGIAALKILGDLKKEMNITNVVFVIAPRINAAGRMDDARKVVEMFIEEDCDRAMEFAKLLHADNSDRKEADSMITSQALEMISTDQSFAQRKTSVVFRDDWHKGVVGIVASRLIEHYYRPTVVLTKNGDLVTGSARSVPGFNLYEAIYACREHLVAYGGHYAAAGLTMLPENVSIFSQEFENVVASTIPPELLIPEIKVDAEIEFSDITFSFHNIVCQMEPFGPENMRPVFLTRNVTDTGYSKKVKEDHLRIVVKKNGHSLSGIGFALARKLELLQQGPVDILYHIEENEYNGTRSLQLRLLDLRRSE